jgi:hypothetical protein
MGNILMIVGTALSLVTSIIAITVVITQMRSNVDALKDQETRLVVKNEAVVKDLVDLLVLVKSFIAEQAVINKMVARTLDEMVSKFDKHQYQGSDTDTRAAIGLLADVLKQRGMIPHME